MKEDIDFRKTFAIQTQSTLPYTHPSLLRKTTMSPQMTLLTATSRKQTYMMGDLQHPELLRQGRYEKVFNDTLRDIKKIYKHLSGERETIEQMAVKKSIAQVLRQSDQEHDFNDRFLIKPKLRCRTALPGERNKYIGSTKNQKEQQFRRNFFSNHKKIIALEQDCMLLEYFLKDEDENRQKTPTTYLNSVPQTSRHRRLTPGVRQSNQLHGVHDQKQYRSLKKRVHLKEQFVQRCAEVARKNLTYRRRQNFRQIQYILRQNNRNMMQEDILHDRTDEERLQLRKNNHLIRLFLKYQFFISHNRVHEYFTEQCIAKFKNDLYAIDANFSFRDKDINSKISEIMQFKKIKLMHFQDFKELVYHINTITKSDILVLFLEKYPQYFEHKSDKIIKAHQQQIDAYMSKHKIRFLLQIFFNTYPDKLIGKKVLPIKLFPHLFKAYGITEKDYDLQHFFHSYHWMQHYDAGLTFEEFYRGSILLGMKGNNWKGIQHLVKKIDIKKYL